MIAIIMTFVVPALLFILYKRLRGKSYEEIVGEKETFTKKTARNFVIFIIALATLVGFAYFYLKSIF